MHPFSDRNFPASCYRAILWEMGFVYKTCPYRAAFASSFTLDFKERKKKEVKFSKGKTHGKGEFSSPDEMNLAGVNTKQII